MTRARVDMLFAGSCLIRLSEVVPPAFSKLYQDFGKRKTGILDAEAIRCVRCAGVEVIVFYGKTHRRTSRIGVWM